MEIVPPDLISSVQVGVRFFFLSEREILILERMTGDLYFLWSDPVAKDSIGGKGEEYIGDCQLLCFVSTGVRLVNLLRFDLPTLCTIRLAIMLPLFSFSSVNSWLITGD